MSKEENLRKLVNSSGFLFQLRVEHEILQSFRSHGWQVLTREHAWADAESKVGGFIDLVLENPTNLARIVVECKRPRDANWVFLVPNQMPDDVTRASAQWTSHRVTSDQQLSPMGGWFDFWIIPGSQEAEFCVVRGSGEEDRGMLERLSGNLLVALDCLAREEQAIRAARKFTSPQIYIPFIVTTAQLEVCRVNPEEISLLDGTIPAGNFEPVPFIRFRKSLTTRLSPNARPRDLKEANEDRERTVFVVNASELTNVLKQWQVRKTIDGYPWDRHFPI